jgi:predicted house-cleaning NTP pyrophosphatase (Maf/HAM1 superfamily)
MATYANHLIALIGDSPFRRKLMLSLVSEVHFKIPGLQSEPIKEGRSLRETLREATDQGIAWSSQYLPRDFSQQFSRLTAVAATSVFATNGKPLLKDLEPTLTAIPGGRATLATYLRVTSFGRDPHDVVDQAAFVETGVVLADASESEFAEYLASKDYVALRDEATWFRPDAKFIAELNGSASNILGLPLADLSTMLQKIESIDQ